MENKTARACKITAIIIWVLGGIASIIYAKEAAEVTTGYFREDVFEISIFLKVIGISLLSVFTTGLFLYSLGEIVQLLQDIKYRQPGNAGQTEFVNKLSHISDGQPNIEDLKNKGRVNSMGNWECKVCKAMNSSMSLYCKECGNYR